MRSWMLAVIVLGACEKAGGGTKTVELPMPQVTVRLIDPGAEPRAVLRNRGPLGAYGTYQTTIQATLESPRQKTLPRRTHTSESALVDVDANGVRHMRDRIVDATDRATIGNVLESWRDDRGRHVRPTLMTLSADAKPPGEGAGKPELMTVYPDEAIGVGARWHEDVMYRGKRASVDSELLSRDGDRVRVRATYHVDTSIDGHPTTRDGTINSEWSTTGTDGTFHEVDTIVVARSDVTIRGTETTDAVKLK